MSPHAPPHLKDIARLLMAGEDVRYMTTPNIAVLVMLEAIVACGSFVILWAVFMVFSDLPTTMKAAFAAIAAVFGVVIIHLTIGLRRYIVTDQRILVVTPFAKDVHDSCELGDIASVRVPKFSRSLIIERHHGKPLRLWALADIGAALAAMNIKELGPQGVSNSNSSGEEPQQTQGPTDI